MRYAAVFAVAASLGVAGVASGASFDGTKALVCTFESLAECDTDALCQSVESGEIDLPESIRVDFNGKRLRTEDGQRSSPIHSTDITDAVLIAQGSQNGRGWSMTIDRATGHMTGTIAEPAGAMVLFGTCADAP
jgi:hypothetical protein